MKLRNKETGHIVSLDYLIRKDDFKYDWKKLYFKIEDIIQNYDIIDGDEK